MKKMLNGTELNLLFSQVFGFSPSDSGHRIGFLVDVPTHSEDDTDEWKERRSITMSCARALSKTSFHACFVYAYESVGRNNAELSHPVHNIALKGEIPDTADQLNNYPGVVADPEEIYSRAEFWVAMTQFSAVRPLKLAAARYGFRAAALPGFCHDMTPSLSVDLALVEARVSKLAHALTEARMAEITFNVKGVEYTLSLDLRFRMGIASSGRFMNNGQAGTLPAGEAYAAPYEGEKIGMISMTEGILPLEENGQIALCEVSENRIVCIDGDNSFADWLRRTIQNEPAMANIAELGLGILGEWGIEAVGKLRHDEKLAPHIAIGRSEHIGGVTSPADFRVPANASHVDFIFHHSIMPDISISQASFVFDDRETVFMRYNRYIYDAI